jgi:hypothetical protein
MHGFSVSILPCVRVLSKSNFANIVNDIIVIATSIIPISYNMKIYFVIILIIKISYFYADIFPIYFVNRGLCFSIIEYKQMINLFACH